MVQPKTTSEEVETYLRRKLEGLPVTIKVVNATKGKGLFATQDLRKDEIIFHEKPVVCSQYLYNKMYFPACSHCLRSLESPAQMAKRLGQLESVPRLPDYPGVKPSPNETPKTFPCMECHGREIYCSEECREEAWKTYHKVLCVGGNASDDHPLIQLEELWKSIHPPPESASIMLLARIVANIIQRLDSGLPPNDAFLPFEFYRKDYYSKELDMSHKFLDKQFEESIDMLNQAFKEALFDARIEEFFSKDGFRSLITLIALNGQGIGTSSFHSYLTTLPPPPDFSHYNKDTTEEDEEEENPTRLRVGGKKRGKQASEDEPAGATGEEKKQQQNEGEEQGSSGSSQGDKGKQAAGGSSNSGSGTDADASAGQPTLSAQEDLLLNYLEDVIMEKSAPFLLVEGTGLYPLHSSLNHACEPNAEIRFSQGNSTLEVVLLDDVRAGEEITINYLESMNLDDEECSDGCCGGDHDHGHDEEEGDDEHEHQHGHGEGSRGHGHGHSHGHGHNHGHGHSHGGHDEAEEEGEEEDSRQQQHHQCKHDHGSSSSKGKQAKTEQPDGQDEEDEEDEGEDGDDDDEEEWEDIEMTVDERREQLRKFYLFQCECSRCLEESGDS